MVVGRGRISDICRMPKLDHPAGEATDSLNGAVIAVLSLVAIGGAADLVLDAPANWWSAHVLLEVALVSTSVTLAAVLWSRGRALSDELRSAHAVIAEREAEVTAWRASSEAAIASFRDAVTAQMERWELTPSEAEVALLLLQGLGHKQIAGQTGRSERTVRQHAVSVYNKSGQRGRAELAAFFLAGLRPPKGEPPTS